MGIWEFSVEENGLVSECFAAVVELYIQSEEGWHIPFWSENPDDAANNEESDPLLYNFQFQSSFDQGNKDAMSLPDFLFTPPSMLGRKMA